MGMRWTDRTDLSRLAEQRGGWLGAQWRDPENDPPPEHGETSDAVVRDVDD